MQSLAIIVCGLSAMHCCALDADGQNNSGRMDQPVTIEVEEHPWAPYMRRTEPSDLGFPPYGDSDRPNSQR